MWGFLFAVAVYSQIIYNDKFMYPKTVSAVFLFIALLLIAPGKSTAQIGAKAGFNMYNVITRDANGDEVYTNPKLNPGFHLGITYNIPVAEKFFIQPAALFSTKGYRIKRVEEYQSVESYINPYYIEVPVNMFFAPEFGPGRLLLGVGPYVAYGIGGKGKYYQKLLVDDEIISSNESANLQFLKDFDNADDEKWTYGKALDYGAQISAGYEFNKKFSFQVTGQLGLANLKPAESGEKPTDKLRNFGFAISVGYMF